MNLEKFFSQEFLARLAAVAAQREMDETRVLDDWVINTQLWTPINRWERDAEQLSASQNLGLFTINAPVQDLRVLMGLAYLASVTGIPPSAFLAAPAPSNPAREKLFDTLDTMETLLEETIARGTWDEDGFDKRELTEAITDFFKLLRQRM